MSTSSSQPITPVVIIGAGLSGLATAVRLRALGIFSVVYEAQSYPGGRVRTIRHSTGVNVDLGATWFHGTVGNAALDLAVESGAIAPPKPPLSEHMATEQNITDELGSLVFATKGIHVLPSGEIRPLDPAVPKRIITQYASQLYSMDKLSLDEASPDVSLLDVMRKSTGYAQMTALERAIFRSRDLLECVVNGCNQSTAMLSAKRIDDYIDLPGDNFKPGDEGMSVVVAGLMAKLEYPQVVLNAEVTSVSWGLAAANPGSERVKIGFRDGKTVYAESVVWTPSLNVTKKAIADGLFSPQLPERKIEAVNGRHQGVIEKVFVVLERPLESVVSNCTIPVVQELDVNDERAGVKSMEWQKSVYGLTYDDNMNAICFWLSGDAAVRFGKLKSEEKVIETSTLLTHLLQQTIGVEEVLNSCWGMNEFVCGSYSFPGVGCGRNSTDVIAEALPCEETRVLCFAGEATHNKYYSTMHGAIESGYREAERCGEFLRKLAKYVPKSNNDRKGQAQERLNQRL